MSTLLAVASRGFQPARLRLARQLRGIRQNALADRVGVTAAAVSQYERGVHEPTASVVRQMALVLGCSPDFFYKPAFVDEAPPAFFRSLRATPQIERDRAAAYVAVLGEIIGLLERDVELPKLDFPGRVPLPPDAARETIEAVSAGVREAWNVSPGPIANVVRLLEAHGVVVAAVGAFDGRMDAFSTWLPDRPVVILCSEKGVAGRRRFDAAHELGHLVMHSVSNAANQRIERQAHEFAAALLMPAVEIESWLPRRSNQLDLLEEGSKTWGVSMQALLYRARTLGALSETAYVRAMRRLSQLGWRRDEPVQLGPPETPTLIEKSVTALAEAGGTLNEVAERLGVPPGRLARMLQVPEVAAEEVGSVLPFRKAG